MNKKVRINISLDKEYSRKLTYLAELEHRRLSQQIIHMTEFYLNHQAEIKNLLEQFIHNQYEPGIVKSDFIKTMTNASIKIHARPRRLKTSQVLQENKGIIVSDVPEKKTKTVYENLSS